jgi:anaerobic selenocysteine-containing dehydrogenase
MEKVVRTICQSCHCECGVLVQLKDNTIVDIKGDPNHPMNRGFICPKGKAQPQLVNHPDRLKYPLKRTGRRGEGRWERISWDEALGGIAQQLTRVKEEYGPEAIAAIHGTGPRASLVCALVPFALGSPNRISVDLHICFAPSLLAEGVTVGHPIMLEVGPDYRSSNCIILWGANPVAAHPPRGKDILDAKARGAKLIVIDPRKTLLAEKADLWLPLRPGTADALALGMIHVVIEKGIYDKTFVDRYCVGFNRLRERVREYTPERVAEITWVSADKIRDAAVMYATTKPAALHHRIGVEQDANAVQTDRALIILLSLAGNIDVKGGNLLPMHIEGHIPTIAIAGAGPWCKPSDEVIQKRIGIKEYPLMAGPDAPLPFVPSPLAVDAMLTGEPYPVKALYCAGGNPIINAQNSKKVLKALLNLDLSVVVDYFMTPTAEFADYVLPATSWLERDDVCDLSYPGYVSARQKVMEPLYECWDDLKIVIELIKRIPWADRKIVPWNDVYECYDWLLKGMGSNFEDLKKKGFISVEHAYRKYEKSGFDTPSGKVELYSSVFEKYGYDPLPRYKEPPESPLTTPQLMKDYPLILTTGGRSIAYMCSEGRQIQSLRKLTPDPEVDIHPDTAKELNVQEGDWVWIETPQIRGERVRLKAALTPRIDRRVVHAAYGWWYPEMPGPEHGCFDSNINVILSGDPPRDEICASVPTRATLCRIYR